MIKKFILVSLKKSTFVTATAFIVAMGGFFVSNNEVKAVDPGFSPGDVIINEFSSTSSPEWVELLNTTSSPIDLTGWTIKDSLNDPESLTSLGVIPAYGIVVFEHVSGWLNNTPTTETITVFDNSSALIHTISYGSAESLDITAPIAGQSGSFNGTTWSISDTPTRGWFNGNPTITSIVAGIESGGVTTNMGTINNPSATPVGVGGLYFEKTGFGRVTFTVSLNLTDANTTTFLQSLDTYMIASVGSMKFDARTATQLKNAGAEIKMYGLDVLGFTSTPSIIVKDDSGAVILSTDVINYPTLNVASYTAGTLTFTTNHFTQFDLVSSDAYVDDDDATCAGQTPCYTDIQSAISATPAGGTIHLAAGTYTEVGQIIINKNLIIIGADKVTTIIKPAQDTGNVDTGKGWFLVNSGITFNLSNVTLDGEGYEIYHAIQHQGSGTINNVKFINIKYEASGPAYQGAGVRVVGTGNVDVTNSQFSEMGRYGVQIYWDSAPTGTYSGNTYTGKGVGNWLDYAFEIGGGAHITITNNTISGNRGLTTPDGWDSSGISVWDDLDTQATINNNTFTDNHIGIAIAVINGGLSSPVTTVGTGNTFTGNDIGIDVQSIGAFGSPAISITGSTFTNNTTGLAVVAGMTASNISIHTSSFSGGTTHVANSGTGSINAENNWWGTADSTAIAGMITGVVDFDPYYINQAKTILSNAGPAIVYVDATFTDGVSGGHTFGYDAFTTIQAGINAVAETGTVNVAAGTYDEQIVIDGKNLTLLGVGDTTIIRPSAPTKLSILYTYPAGTFWPGTVLASVVLVKNSTDATLKDFKLDGVNVNSSPTGAGRITGILYGESSGLVDNVTVTTIKVTDYSVRSYGIDLSATSGTQNVEVKNSRVTDWSRNGIQVQGANITANLHDNILVGPGDDSILQSTAVPNGILFIQGAHGNATLNTISGMHHNLSGSRSAGILIYGDNTTGIMLDQNNISDVDDGILLSASSHDIIVKQNNLHNNLEVGLHLEGATANNIITNNTISDNAIAGIRFSGAADPTFPDSAPGVGNVAHKNTFSGNGYGIVNWDTQTFDATNNWWGESQPDFVTQVNGLITYDPWYTNAEMTTLNTYTDATYDSTTDGQADLPSGITDIILSDDTKLDVSSGVEDAVGTDITIGGLLKDLNDFSSGDLNNEDLTETQVIGDASVDISKAVTLQSGTDTEPIILTNSELDSVEVSIPDGTTVLAGAGWDGLISPPRTGTSSGDAPSGFSVGDTVIEVGSSTGVLLFDKAVKITLTGVTGTVAYKPAGSNEWVTIGTQCTSATVYSNISFPNECYFTDGGDTIIWTYHFTSFGGLDEVVPPSGGGGGGGYYYSPTPTPTPTPTVTPIPTPKPEVLGESIVLGNPANLKSNGLKEGDLIVARGSNNESVYIVNQFGYKRVFVSPAIFNMYGHLKNGWGKIRSIIAQSRDSFPTSGLFRNCETKDPKVYAIETTGEDTAVLHWVNIKGDQAVAQDPEFFKKVFCVNTTEFNWYTKSSVDYDSLSKLPAY